MKIGWGTLKVRVALFGTIGLLSSLGLAVLVHFDNRRQLDARLTQLSGEAAQIVRQRFGLYEYGLRGARGAVIGAGGSAISRPVFEAYVASRDTAREFPGARGFGFIRRVSAGGEAAFLAQARAEGPADFVLRELGPIANERFVIQYIYPLETNRAAMGLDIASESRRRAAALSAAREGKAHLTAPLTLVQADGMPRHGFLALLPVYNVHTAAHSDEARQAAALGWVYAPLLVDDVLADLGPVLDQLRITLTDAEEQAPFYESSSPEELAPIPTLATQELDVFGRHWQLRATARAALATEARLPKPAWIGAGSALGWMLLTLLFLAWLQRRQALLAAHEPGTIEAAGEVSFSSFLRSHLARRAGLAFLLAFALFGWIEYQRQWALQAAGARNALKGLVDGRADRIKATQVSRRKTLSFLADTPPVQGLVRASASGVDPLDGSSREQWTQRMQQIFLAHMRSSPEVAQARLIGVADSGRELIRAERRGSELVIVPAGQLQAKGDRPYMQQTLRLHTGDVLVSQVELNQEHGKLEVPHRPTIRYSTPIYTSRGELFGIVIVNIDIAQPLAESAAAVPIGVALHILNSTSDYLMHPDSGMSFGFDLGRRHRWEDDHQPAELPSGMDPNVLQAWVDRKGSLIVTARAVVDPNAGSSIGRLTYVASQAVAPLVNEAVRSTSVRLVPPLLAGLAGALLLYFYWVGVQRQWQARSQRLRLAAIVDHSRDAIVSLDAEGRVLSWNRGAEDLFGIHRDEALGISLAELVSDPRRPLLLDDCDVALQEHWCMTHERKELLLSMSVSRLDASEMADDGASLSVILRDVTVERQAQQALSELNEALERQVQERTAALDQERERLQNILRGSDAGTWEWNVRTGEARFNERWAGIIGYKLEELAPVSVETWHAHQHPDDRLNSERELQRHFHGGVEQYVFESRMHHKDGHWVWVLDRGRVITRTDDGLPEWMFGTRKDVTTAKTAQLELARLATLLESVLDAATEVAIIATDPQGLITIFNRGAERLLGYDASEMVGLQTPAPLHLASEISAYGDELSAAYGETIEGFRVFVHRAELDGADQHEWTYVRKDGSHVPVLLVATSIRADDGSIVGYLGIAENISVRKRTEAALLQAKSAADSANAAKSLFLANMSHEIRTPMNALIGIAHLLQSTPLDLDQRQLLSKLHIAGRSLLGVINNVLDLSKIEAGEMGVELAPLQPANLLDELHQVFSPQAESKGIFLRVERASTLPAFIEGDELRLRQILSNLLSNAIKFTARGEVTLRVAEELPVGDRRWLRWSVTDSGEGIPAASLGKLFNPFVQGDASTTRRFGGTGLGLAIVRHLAELLGGEVGARSSVGHGSEFWLRSPLTPVELHAGQPSRSVGGEIEVIVVDDVPDERRGLGRLCRALGWRTVELASGEDLIDHCTVRLSAGQSLPDALLVDWQMTGIDGVQALHQLAHQTDVTPLPAMLVISAHERTRIQHQDDRHLIDAILTKPVTGSELFNAINQSVARKTGSTDRVARATKIRAVDALWLEGLQILLVDDSDINLDVGRRLLEREGASVLTAQNGQEALDRLRETPERFDAVLMDVQMPVMDGYEATARLRTELGLARLPVLALTAGALGEEKRRAEAAGMTDFLTKPLDPASLVHALRHAIERARGQPLPLVPHPTAVRTSDGSLPAADWPAIDGIDTEDVAHRLNGDRELFLRMLKRMLLEFSGTNLGPLSAGDLGVMRDELAAKVHKLRGGSGQLGATEVHRLAGEAEAALRSGASEGQLNPVFEALAQALQRLAQASAGSLTPAARLAEAPLSAKSGEQVLAEGVLAQFVERLRQQDLSAIEQLKQMAPALRSNWGEESYSRLREAVEELDFTAALLVVQDSQDRMQAPEH